MAASDSTRWTIIRGAAEGQPLDRAEFARLAGGSLDATPSARTLREKASTTETNTDRKRPPTRVKSTSQM